MIEINESNGDDDETNDDDDAAETKETIDAATKRTMPPRSKMTTKWTMPRRRGRCRDEEDDAAETKDTIKDDDEVDDAATKRTMPPRSKMTTKRMTTKRTMPPRSTMTTKRTKVSTINWTWFKAARVRYCILCVCGMRMRYAHVSPYLYLRPRVRYCSLCVCGMRMRYAYAVRPRITLSLYLRPRVFSRVSRRFHA
jgi:hypothetical protein